ncbi:hypothetical protein JXB31_03570 [Candidatus Woesearchaeota archaeon]|nr:hypothetical protein [Candidatus Woesearchaeota archaeon]
MGVCCIYQIQILKNPIFPIGKPVDYKKGLVYAPTNASYDRLNNTVSGESDIFDDIGSLVKGMGLGKTELAFRTDVPRDVPFFHTYFNEKGTQITVSRADLGENDTGKLYSIIINAAP